MDNTTIYGVGTTYVIPEQQEGSGVIFAALGGMLTNYGNHSNISLVGPCETIFDFGFLTRVVANGPYDYLKLSGTSAYVVARGAHDTIVLGNTANGNYVHATGKEDTFIFLQGSASNAVLAEAGARVTLGGDANAFQSNGAVTGIITGSNDTLVGGAGSSVTIRPGTGNNAVTIEGGWINDNSDGGDWISIDNGTVHLGQNSNGDTLAFIPQPAALKTEEVRIAGLNSSDTLDFTALGLVAADFSFTPAKNGTLTVFEPNGHVQIITGVAELFTNYGGVAGAISAGHVTI